MRRRPVVSKLLKRFEALAVACFFVASAVSGCSRFLINYEGAKIKEGYAIAIETAGKQVGHYTTRDLTVDYEYQRKGDTLQISGKVRFADYLRRDYGLRYFNLSLLLADQDNAIIENQALTSAGYGGPITFNRTLNLPGEARTMVFAFTYTGEVMGGGDGGGPYDFWEYPIVR